MVPQLTKRPSSSTAARGLVVVAPGRKNLLLLLLSVPCLALPELKVNLPPLPEACRCPLGPALPVAAKNRNRPFVVVGDAAALSPELPVPKRNLDPVADELGSAPDREFDPEVGPLSPLLLLLPEVGSVLDLDPTTGLEFEPEVNVTEVELVCGSL